MPRYLEYDIASKQSQPTFHETFPVAVKEECDEGFTVMVDLLLERRYYRGEWRKVPTAKVWPEEALYTEGDA